MTTGQPLTSTSGAITDDPCIYLLMTLVEIDSARSSGRWSSAAFPTEGFIHASPANQLERVANKHYRQKVDVHVVCVRPELLTSELRWEPAAGSFYPHIYGPLNFDAVVKVVPTERNADGTFRIPDVRAVAGQLDS